MNTQIRLRAETREALKKMGTKGDTYDTVIRKLIEEERKRDKAGESGNAF